MIMKITFLDAATLGEDMKDIIYDKFGVFGEVTLLNSAAPTDVLKAAADSDVLVVNKIKMQFRKRSVRTQRFRLCALRQRDLTTLTLNIARTAKLPYATSADIQHTVWHRLPLRRCCL